MKDEELNEIYIQYAESLSELITLENKLSNQKILAENLRKTLLSEETDGGYGIDMTAHAFKQISERMEDLVMENGDIRADVLNTSDPEKSLIMPSNLKSFIISILADARKKGFYKKIPSKSGGSGIEFHFTIEIKKWSNERVLQFTGIVENGNIKTGYFNWI